MIAKKTPKRILGIDPGVGRVGFGVVIQEGSRLTCEHYGCITTAAGSPLPGRLLAIHKEIDALIDTYRPDVMAVEKLFFYNNTKTAIDVAQARGVIVLTATMRGLPLLELTPLQAKQAVAGYGQAPKVQVQRMVKLILGLTKNPTPDDAADALAIAICAGQMGTWHFLK